MFNDYYYSLEQFQSTIRVFIFQLFFALPASFLLLLVSLVAAISFSLTNIWPADDVKCVWNSETENRSEHLNLNIYDVIFGAAHLFTPFTSTDTSTWGLYGIGIFVMMTGVVSRVCIFHCRMHRTECCMFVIWMLERDWKTGGSFRHAQHILPLQKHFLRNAGFRFNLSISRFCFSCFSAQKWFAGVFVWMSHASAVEFIR